MKEKENLNVEVMFSQACAFVDCASFTESEKYKIEHRTYSHGYAGISLSALACEIFIKCLIIIKGGEYNKEHKLDQLWAVYKELDETNAQNVEDHLKWWFKSSAPDMFDKMIEDASNAFVQWRYVFDYGSEDGIRVNPMFLIGFRSALRDLCCYMIYKKNWKEYIEG